MFLVPVLKHTTYIDSSKKHTVDDVKYFNYIFSLNISNLNEVLIIIN